MSIWGARRLKHVRFALAAATVLAFTALPAADAQIPVQNEVTCTPAHVAAIGSDGNYRVHVFCSNVIWHTTKQTGGNFFFAAPASDPLFVPISAILANAMASGRKINMRVAPAEASGGFGCQVSDCRRIVDAWFGM
jgi:hypothetical protein